VPKVTTRRKVVAWCVLGLGAYFYVGVLSALVQELTDIELPDVDYPYYKLSPSLVFGVPLHQAIFAIWRERAERQLSLESI
jgi:hypothetical protein